MHHISARGVLSLSGGTLIIRPVDCFHFDCGPNILVRQTVCRAFKLLSLALKLLALKLRITFGLSPGANRTFANRQGRDRLVNEPRGLGSPGPCRKLPLGR